MHKFIAEQITEIQPNETNEQLVTEYTDQNTTDVLQQDEPVDVYPYYDENSPEVLERWYTLDEKQWPLNDNPVEINPYKLINNVPNLKRVAETHSRIKSDMEIEFKITPTIGHYGLLLIFLKHRALLPSQLYTNSHCEHYVLSANNPEQIRIRIPHRSWYYHDAKGASRIRVCYQRLGQLRDMSDATAKLDIHILARFVDPSLYVHAQMDYEEVDEETESKSRGKLTNIAHNVKVVTGAVKDLPVIGGIASTVSNVAGFSEKLFDYFGWTKPTTVEKVVLTKECSYAHMANGRGIAQHIKLIDDQTAVMADDREIFREKYPVLTIKDLALRPLISWQDTLSANTTTALIPLRMPEWLEWFHGWRGGFKFMIYFAASLYTTCRVMIHTGKEEDGPHMFVDIKGDTIVKFTTPYEEPTFTRGSGGIPHPRVKMVNKPSASIANADTSIEMIVWQSFAEDFELYDFRGYDSMYVDDTVMAQLCVNEEFQDTFDGIIPCKFLPTNQPLTGVCSMSIKEILMTPIYIGKTNVTHDTILHLTSALRFLAYFVTHRINLRITLKGGTNKSAVKDVGRVLAPRLHAEDHESLDVEIPLTDYKQLAGYYKDVLMKVEGTNVGIWISISDDSSFGNFERPRWGITEHDSVLELPQTSNKMEDYGR